MYNKGIPTDRVVLFMIVKMFTCIRDNNNIMLLIIIIIVYAYSGRAPHVQRSRYNIITVAGNARKRTKNGSSQYYHDVCVA